ncbi:hypothetical protein HO133_000470 [Letharia lupina]|uniref:Glutathione synthetase n=1 Tax=Letharia lupina TaxID=560253 RepID=A0A8H6FCQ0_9LECA|nr:uncharacterized protein HO133_000470 [Letharia lupina]KAF6223627.1 hypothetical protein HO133_000470 [Letharia lupina]
MAALIYPDYPPNLTSEQSDYIVSNIKDWSILSGLAVRPSSSFVSEKIDPSRSLAVTAPVTLFPSLFPRECFEEARAIQTAYNELYACIANDEEWLGEVVKELAEVDDFISNLWNVHQAVKKEGYVQDLSLGIFRSDYMVHKDPSNQEAKTEIKQVEFNTIASSFGGLSAKVSALHKHLLSISAYPPTIPPLISDSSLPPNPSIASLSRGIATAHKAYGRPKTSSQLPLCTLFIVQDLENNAFDQHALATNLLTDHSVLTFRLPFSTVLAHTSIPSDSPSQPLIYTPPHSPSTPYEVTTLYFRAGYSPAEYTSPNSWNARLHLERSAAIKCPSILTHLAGSKKIQQILATPSSPHLSRFLSSTASAAYIDRIQATFAAIYPLDDTAEGKHAIEIATDPERIRGYVLKPQREGGGNNIYGLKIPPFIKSLGDDSKKYRGHILMELIEPPALRNGVFRNGEVTMGEVIGELGVYGVCLWRHGRDEKGEREILENWEAGHLLRTKGRESEEGGVAAGFGAVDSVCLIDV